MINLSIALPNRLTQESTEIAKKIGISRTEFIRQAVIHEVNYFKKTIEQEKIIKCFNAMKNSPEYLRKAEELIDDFDYDLELTEGKN